MPVALITGCSSGIGRAAALGFARAGYHVYATVRTGTAGRDLERAAAGSELETAILDVTDSRAAAELVERIISADGLDVLVNNAGVALPGALEDLDSHDMERVMAVNFMAPLLLSRLVLPHMRERGRGHVIMVSSLSALVGLPGEAIYAASKAALEAASESLRHEVARFGISVSAIEPGHVNTEMPARIQEGLQAPAGSAYAPLMAHLRHGAEQGIGRGEDPEVVAKILLEIAANPSPAFRFPAGAQARQVVTRLHDLDADAREHFIRDVNDTAWWSAGKAGPA